MNEEWKDIEGYRGLYKISNTGRVKSFKQSIPKVLKNRESKTATSKQIYYKVVLYDKLAITKSFTLHKLVALHFIENPNNYKVILHLDGNSLNNNSYNLRWGLFRENITVERLKRKKTSRYTGVCWDKKRAIWRASATIKQKHYHLGTHETELSAKRAYDLFIKNVGLVNREAHKITHNKKSDNES